MNQGQQQTSGYRGAASYRAAAMLSDTPTRHVQASSQPAQQPQLTLEDIRRLLQEQLTPIGSDVAGLRSALQEGLGALTSRVDGLEQAQRDQQANFQASMSAMQAQHQQTVTLLQRQHEWDNLQLLAKFASLNNKGTTVVSLLRTAPAGTLLDATAITNQLREELGQVPVTSHMGAAALKVQLPEATALTRVRAALAANPNLYVRPFFSTEETALREAATLFAEWAGSHERLRTLCTFTVYRRRLYVHEGADADTSTAAGWAPCTWLFAHVDWVEGRPVLADLDADMVQQRALQSLEEAHLGPRRAQRWAQPPRQWGGPHRRLGTGAGGRGGSLTV
jgi:hypothetical protein